MNEQSAPSKIAIPIVLFLFGFLPFGWLGLMFLEKLNEKVFMVILLFWIVFLAAIAFTIILRRLAMKSWDDKRKVAGIYSVLFGSMAILFAGLAYICVFLAREGLWIFLITYPALYGFPIVGLILGLIGFKGKWGKTGLLLVVVNFVLWAFEIPFG